jgi:hypothetical protein
MRLPLPQASRPTRPEGRPVTELAPEPATYLARADRHCPTCQCAPAGTDSLTVYPPHEGFYGRCDVCDRIRWATEIYTNGRGSPHRAQHCACCTHPHDLKSGGHTIPTRGKP